MAQFTKIINNGTAADSDTIKALVEQYPWFEAARTLDKRGSLRYDIDFDTIREMSEGEIIERFLRKGDYRIVAEEGETDEVICTEPTFDEGDDLASEELAEIYLAQGLKSEAIEIYRKLCLLNPEKIAYFAKKIDSLEKNN